MTWVCLKMMYTPSSWKVFHRDRIFLNQSMLGVTLCSDKAISGWWFGTMEFYDFPYIRNFIVPTDELIFFRGVGLPPTIYIYIFIYIMHGKYQPLLVKLYQCKSKHATYNLVNHNFPMSELRHSHHTMVKAGAVSYFAGGDKNFPEVPAVGSPLQQRDSQDNGWVFQRFF